MTYEYDLGGADAPLVTLHQAPAEFAKLGMPKPHHSAVRRWANRKAIPLPTVVIGSTRYVSPRAIMWFVRATTDAFQAGKQP